MVHPYRWTAATLTAVVTAALVGAVPASAQPHEPDRPAPGASDELPGATTRITLLTGDVVELSPAGGGRYAATVEPAEGRESITFQTLAVDGGMQVLPSDVVPYLSAGVLDERLFDVSRLAEQGYDDAAADDLPLIVEQDAADQPAASALDITAEATSLPSVDATALRADKQQLDELWQAVTGAAGPVASGADDAALAGGIDRIWLDGRVSVDLDASVPQIGTPTAWDAGYDGTGVSVAVLDTGVDADHPDLAGRIAHARDFTGGESATDGLGHGTHVAATVGGTGDAADGDRPGVAPGADLLAGKVLNDFGFGQQSWIIAGMEWAVDAGADIVNLSLGGSATDGTDPLSTAVDALSAQTDTLFVISAGNDGTAYSVGAPGAATSALTVGAVDRDDELADFSSRGPRVGDNALKPEITAPGVGIVAARADGTGMGEPVDTHYTAASGTSMAAPHVAGAAALLAQQHPDWDGEQLKDALVSTADPNPELDAFAQGAGRVDLTRAVQTPVSGTGVLDFGMQEDPEHPEPAAGELSYTNTGDTTVTVELAAELTNLDRGQPADDALVLDTSQVTVPAGETVTVPVELDVPALDRGRHTGEITATGPDGLRVRTVVASTVVGPKHTVTVRAVGADGEPTSSPTVALHGDDRRTDVLTWLPEGEKRTLEVEEGTYMLQALLTDYTRNNEQSNLITDPELSITEDTELVLDARTAEPVRIETPEPSEQREIFSYFVHREMANGRTVSHGVMHFSTVRQLNVTPTEPVSEGAYEFSSRWQLVAPMVSAEVPGMDEPLAANLLHRSPSFDGKRQLPLVDAGDGSPEELAAVDAAGAAVVMNTRRDPTDKQLAAAVEAGAEALLAIIPEGASAWTVWRPTGDREPLPAVRMPHSEGQRLLERMDQPGRATVKLQLTTSSPYLYDVMHVEHDRVPEEIVHQVTRQNTAQFDVEYPDLGGFDWAKEQRFGWRPWQDYSWHDSQRFMAAGTEREEWVSSGDTLWQHRVHHEYTWDEMNPLRGGMVHKPTAYQAGPGGTVRWHGPVVRPAAPVGVPELVSTRVGDRLQLRVPEFVDSSDRHIGQAYGSEVAARLLRDGELVTELPNAMRDVPVEPGAARYRLELDTERDYAEWQWATRTETAWEFRSETPADGDPRPLRLLQVDYDVPADLANTVRGTGVHQVGLEFRHQDGLPAPQVNDVTVAVSFDEGEHWQQVPVRGPAHNLRAQVPAGDGTVSLRVDATAADGSAVTQTVIRAYGLR